MQDIFVVECDKQNIEFCATLFQNALRRLPQHKVLSISSLDNTIYVMQCKHPNQLYLYELQSGSHIEMDYLETLISAY